MDQLFYNFPWHHSWANNLSAPFPKNEQDITRSADWHPIGPGKTILSNASEINQWLTVVLGPFHLHYWISDSPHFFWNYSIPNKQHYQHWFIRSGDVSSFLLDPQTKAFGTILNVFWSQMWPPWVWATWISREKRSVVFRWTQQMGRIQKSWVDLFERKELMYPDNVGFTTWNYWKPYQGLYIWTHLLPSF